MSTKVMLSCSSFKPYYRQLRSPCSATILVATYTQFKCTTAYYRPRYLLNWRDWLSRKVGYQSWTS